VIKLVRDRPAPPLIPRGFGTVEPVTQPLNSSPAGESITPRYQYQVIVGLIDGKLWRLHRYVTGSTGSGVGKSEWGSASLKEKVLTERRFSKTPET